MPTDAEAIELLREVVATPSVSGYERAAVGVFVRHAARMGLRAWIDEAGNGLAEIGARPLPEGGVGDGPASAGSASGVDVQTIPPSGPLPLGGGVTIALLGHIDTVPGPIRVRIEDGVLHGRGSVDAKGPLCAMLVAAARAQLPEGVRVLVCAAVGEETPHSPGARHLAHTLRPDACIIGEPSHWDGVTLGYKGRLVLRARVRQESGHSAGPHGSPSDELMGWWMGVRAMAETLSDGRRGAFDVIQAGVRSMASESDGLHDEATMVAGFRLPTWIGPDDLADRVRGITPASVELTFEGREHAIVVDRNDAVVRALSHAIREEGGKPHPKVKTGTADMNVVGPVWKCPIAAYGPGDSGLDHTPRERLEVAEYLRAVRVLVRGVEGLAREVGSHRAQPFGSSPQ